MFDASRAARPAGMESLGLFVLKKSFFFFYVRNIFLLGIKFWLKDFFPSFGTLPCPRGVFGRSAPRVPIVAAGMLLRPLRKCPRHHGFDVSCGFDYCALGSELLIFILLGALLNSSWNSQFLIVLNFGTFGPYFLNFSLFACCLPVAPRALGCWVLL